MVITLHKDADSAQVKAQLQRLGLWCQSFTHPNGIEVFVTQSHSRVVPVERVQMIPGVDQVASKKSPHPRLDEQAGAVVRIGPVAFGSGAQPVLLAGPCAVESEAQIHATARMVAAAGAQVLRGGAFKPRTSPYSFAGHGRVALGWLREAADACGLLVVTEALSEKDVEAVGEITDMMQIGTRNMQNFALLRAVGELHKPVLLKRGMAARVEEWLLAGEYLLAAGASGVVLCERGVVGFDPSTRNLLDLAAVALVAEVHGLPVVVDPTHALGRADLVVPMARAAVAAGAHGVMVEAHPSPAAARSDGPQALDADDLLNLRWPEVRAFPRAAAGAEPGDRIWGLSHG